MIFSRVAFSDLLAKPFRLLEPEAAQALTVILLRAGFGPKFQVDVDPCLATTVAGISFRHPVGLAPGFDKNGLVIDEMLEGVRFGFVEIGAITPKPQYGNVKPRVFRLPSEKAVINRRGFSNQGAHRVIENLNRRKSSGIVGINLGANKDSTDWIEDYEFGIKTLSGYSNYLTLNISSPNTPGLRNLQSPDRLFELLTRVLKARADSDCPNIPLFLKVAPDLSDNDKSGIVRLVLNTKFRDRRIDGLVVSNTTLSRPENSRAKHIGEHGGLSGRPLFQRSTKLLFEFFAEVRGEIPLIGVGGVSSAADVYKKIRAGASLVQLYTALIYEGPSLIPKIIKELPLLLRADGFHSVHEAVGADHSFRLKKNYGVPRTLSA